MTGANDTAIPLPGIAKGGPCVFACGADLKNKFSFLRNGRLSLSGDNGDLSEGKRFARFMEAVAAMSSSLGLVPEIVAHDMHPAYLSTRAADIFPVAGRVGIQHHRAHVASVLAVSPGIDEVIGVAFDGTGYGTDGAVWGGEFLTVSRRGWRRCGHLAYMKMPGGEAAVREPWRMAFSLLSEWGSAGALDAWRPPKAATGASLDFLAAMMDGGINSPPTSSCGRLFDAVSSILGIMHTVSREAEAAIALERAAAAADDAGSYPFEIADRDGVLVAGYGALVDAIVAEVKRGVPVPVIARRFHNALALLILEMARRIGSDMGIRAVALSGGVFQNKLLHASASTLLEAGGFRVLENGSIPVNDLGICVGQLYVASEEWRVSRDNVRLANRR